MRLKFRDLDGDPRADEDREAKQDKKVQVDNRKGQPHQSRGHANDAAGNDGRHISICLIPAEHFGPFLGERDQYLLGTSNDLLGLARRK